MIGEAVIALVDELSKVSVPKTTDDCPGVSIPTCTHLGKTKKGDIASNLVIGKIECTGCTAETYVDECNETDLV